MKNPVFTQNLKEIREESGLTLQQLAYECKTSLNNIARYERGLVEPKLSMLVLIADALNVSLDRLCTNKVNSSQSLLLRKLDALPKDDLLLVSALIDRLG